MNHEQTMGQVSVPVSQRSSDARGAFISKTYNTLFAAIVGFVVLEFGLFQTDIPMAITQWVMSHSWLWFLGAFMVASWLATHIAHSATSKVAQYSGLAGMVVAQALIFTVPLTIAQLQFPGAITSAATVTLLGFIGLTAIAFYTRKDFSFLKSVLMWGGLVALVAIFAGAIFGFQLGTWFSVAMVGFAGAAILYDTSNVLHHYPEDRYVGAALQLFASIAMMFWYVLRLFMARD